MKSKEKRRIHEEEEGDDAFLSPDDENDDVEEDENADPSTPSRSSADDGLRSPLRQVNVPGNMKIIAFTYCSANDYVEKLWSWVITRWLLE